MISNALFGLVAMTAVLFGSAFLTWKAADGISNPVFMAQKISHLKWAGNFLYYLAILIAILTTSALGTVVAAGIYVLSSEQ